MYCDEKINRIVFGYKEGSGGFPTVCYWANPIKMHVKEGRIILITDNWAISLGHDGVSKEPIEEPREELDEEFVDGIDKDEDDELWVTTEATLFTGEKLERVDEDEDAFILDFTDFTLRIIPHDLEDDLIKYSHHKHNFDRIYGMDRLLTRKCECGGDPQLIIEFVDDYMSSCKKCGKATWAGMNAIDAIEDWNAGEIGCVLEPEKVGTETQYFWDDSYHEE